MADASDDRGMTEFRQFILDWLNTRMWVLMAQDFVDCATYHVTPEKTF